jgi:YesN/AraC family two-component response regulator
MASKNINPGQQQIVTQMKKASQEAYTPIKSSPRQPASAQLVNYQMHNAEYNLIHSPYQLEQQLLHAIANGNLDAFGQVASDFSKYSLGQISDSFDKSVEYQTVIGVSLFARAAIEGGVNPYLAYDLNDLYLQQISRCQTLEDFSAVLEHATVHFLDEVKQAQQCKTISPHIEKAKSYIARHLNQTFSIQDLAEEIGINKAYLMRLFQKEEHCTLAHYIQQERIHAAKNMLIYSDYTLEEIANYLQFSSQSYFGMLFKKYEGVTPAAYRRQHQC